MFWQYEKCIECFQKSLSINSLQVSRAHILTLFDIIVFNRHIFLNFYTSTFLSSKWSYDFCVFQVPVWFTFGCACMAAKKFQEAVKAFKRCVNIDTDVSCYSNLCIVVQYSSYKVKVNERLSTFYRTSRPGITWHRPTYSSKTSRSN